MSASDQGLDLPLPHSTMDFSQGLVLGSLGNPVGQWG